MSNNILDPVGDAITDCIKTVSKGISSDDSKMTTYVGSMLGSTVIAVFSPGIGVPLLLFSFAGGIVDICLDANATRVVESKAKEVEKVANEKAKYDIFKCIGCKNSVGEYPEFLYMEDSGYVYSRPEGITLEDVKMYTEDFKLALNLDKVEVLMHKGNRSFMLREFVDRLGKFAPYVNNSRCSNGELLCYVGVTMKKGNLVPLELNFTKNNHLMISSCTGMGKSSVIRVIVIDLMLNYSPDELKFYFVDMKRTELTVFNGYKHNVMDCITEHSKVVEVLDELWVELSRRKDIVSEANFQNMYQYNEANKDNKMNYIVLVIDEMLEVVNSGEKDDIKEVKRLLGLLLSQGRAFGMYFILSTQQPSRKLIEGSIQSNVGQRLSLRVASKTDAEVVFDGIYAPLHLIKDKGRGYFLLGGDLSETQCYYLGDPKLKNEQKVLLDLIKHLKADKKESKLNSLKGVFDKIKKEGD